MMSTDMLQTPCARSDITVQEIGAEVMLYDGVNEKIHVLNHSAYAIWKICNGENNLEDIHAQMSAQYPDARENLIADIQATIKELKEKNFFV